LRHKEQMGTEVLGGNSLKFIFTKNVVFPKDTGGISSGLFPTGFPNFLKEL